MRRSLLPAALLLGLAASAGAATVTVSGRQLLVDGTPFTVKGVDYSPVPVGSAAPFDWSARSDIYLSDIPLIKGMGANAIRIYDPPTQSAAMDAMSGSGLYVIMGYNVPTSWNLADASTRTFLVNGFVSMVNAWKGHPASLMWVFGNEVVANNASAAANPSLFYSLLEAAAQAARAQDPNHPVTTANADMGVIGSSAASADDASLPDVGLWGINAFRGSFDFGAGANSIFNQLAAASAKPLVLLEFGSDAYMSARSPVGENQANQAADLLTQWNTILPNLSAGNPSKVCAGGVVFEWTDEWWKHAGGSYTDHDTAVDSTNAAYFDSQIQEEWFGLNAVSPGGVSRFSRISYSTMTALWGGTAPLTPVPNVMNIYNDTGMGGMQILVWNAPPATAGPVFDGSSTGASPNPEGHTSFKTSFNDGWVGWGVFYDTALNLTPYKTAGALRFWINTSTTNVKIEMQTTSGGVLPLASSLTDSKVSGWTGQFNQWVPLEINLSAPVFAGFDMRSIKAPFQITANVAATFYVDKVRLVKDRSAAFSASLKRRSDNAAASAFSFPATTPVVGWSTADQYVQVDMDAGSNAQWGLQIYTDNKNAAVANPLYTGAAGTNPAGLVDAGTAPQLSSLPLGWHASQVPTSDVQIAGENSFGVPVTSGGRQFQYMKDANTPSIPSQQVTAFQNGQDAVRVWDWEGIHFAPGDKTGNYWAGTGPAASWGPAQSPIYIYLAGRLNTAATPRVYKTTALMLEFFSL